MNGPTVEEQIEQLRRVGKLGFQFRLTARTIRPCTTCRRRRRFIVMLYEWYESRFVCGGCGHTFVSGEGRVKTGKREREKRRQWVAAQWPRVGSLPRLIAAVRQQPEGIGCRCRPRRCM